MVLRDDDNSAESVVRIVAVLRDSVLLAAVTNQVIGAACSDSATLFNSLVIASN